MDKEFLPYQQALELKELGFDEPCFGRYDGRGGNKGKIWYEMPNSGQETIPVGDVLAPTFSQAFRWFREKYNLFSVCFPELDVWVIEIKQLGGMEGNLVIQGYPDLEYNTYEEAELACLIKLIQIVKDGNK